VIGNAGGVVTDDDFKRRVQQETGIKPESATEAFSDLDDDLRQSVAASAGSSTSSRAAACAK
jgi:carbonic anhydrase